MKKLILYVLLASASTSLCAVERSNTKDVESDEYDPESDPCSIESKLINIKSRLSYDRSDSIERLEHFIDSIEFRELEKAFSFLDQYNFFENELDCIICAIYNKIKNLPITEMMKWLSYPYGPRFRRGVEKCLDDSKSLILKLARIVFFSNSDIDFKEGDLDYIQIAVNKNKCSIPSEILDPLWIKLTLNKNRRDLENNPIARENAQRATEISQRMLRNLLEDKGPAPSRKLLSDVLRCIFKNSDPLKISKNDLLKALSNAEDENLLKRVKEKILWDGECNFISDSYHQSTAENSIISIKNFLSFSNDVGESLCTIKLSKNIENLINSIKIDERKLVFSLLEQLKQEESPISKKAVEVFERTIKNKICDIVGYNQENNVNIGWLFYSYTPSFRNEIKGLLKQIESPIIKLALITFFSNSDIDFEEGDLDYIQRVITQNRCSIPSEILDPLWIKLTLNKNRRDLENNPIALENAQRATEISQRMLRNLLEDNPNAPSVKLLQGILQNIFTELYPLIRLKAIANKSGFSHFANAKNLALPNIMIPDIAKYSRSAKSEFLIQAMDQELLPQIISKLSTFSQRKAQARPRNIHPWR